MIQQPLDVTSIGRVTPGPEADRLASASYAAMLDDLSLLTDEDWQRPTECEGWAVRDVVAHLVGAAAGHASTPVFVRQYVWGVRHRKAFGGSGLDAMNQGQIDGLGDQPGDVLITRLRELAPRAVAGRARRARLLGWAPLGLDKAGSWYEGMPSRTTMAELCSIVLTRDVWMHRFDLARAVGRAPTIDPAVDGRLVADVVADWAARHGQPFDLNLTGAAGGTYRAGSGGQLLALDALDFVRLMAGRRVDGETPASPLWTSKVLF